MERAGGDQFSYSAGSNITPYVITVRAGEDIATKIISFSLRERHAISVLSACGSISTVTLRQSNSSGDLLTYKGRFEILSLSGSLMPIDNGITRSRAGSISVSLAGPDGHVFGGGLAGLLVAATPVQIVLGSFLPGHHQEHIPSRWRTEPAAPIVPAIVNAVPAEGYAEQNLNLASPPSSFLADLNLPPVNSNPGSNDLETDNNTSTEGESDDDIEDDEDSASKSEISG